MTHQLKNSAIDSITSKQNTKSKWTFTFCVQCDVVSCGKLINHSIWNSIRRNRTQPIRQNLFGYLVVYIERASEGKFTHIFLSFDNWIYTFWTNSYFFDVCSKISSIPKNFVTFSYIYSKRNIEANDCGPVLHPFWFFFSLVLKEEKHDGE